jgi:hypothetical protein
MTKNAASAPTFVSAVGVFSTSEITPVMVRALDSADDDGRITCSTQTYKKLAQYGLADHKGLVPRITHAGWNASALFPLPVQHKTSTFLLNNKMDMRMRPNGRDRVMLVSQTSKAVCTCSWSACSDNRDGARALARQHRQKAGEQ